jgi:hypothetical protein
VPAAACAGAAVFLKGTVAYPVEQYMQDLRAQPVPPTQSTSALIAVAEFLLHLG